MNYLYGVYKTLYMMFGLVLRQASVFPELMRN